MRNVIGGGWFGQWVRGGLVSALVVLMAAVSAGAVGTPVWATVGRPDLSLQQADNHADNDDAASITLNVNSTLDQVDANPGDGVCATTVSLCTLRAAIMEANLSGVSHIINVPAGAYTMTIAPTGSNDINSGDLNILGRIKIIGAGSQNTIIDANQLDRVFTVASGGSLDLRSVTLQRGLVGNSGGAIYSDGALWVRSSTVRDNQVNLQGGGIYAVSATIIDSSISSNSSTMGMGEGGGLRVSELVVIGSTIENNSAVGIGTAIRAQQASISNSVIRYNTSSQANPVAIFVQTDLDVNQSVVSNNDGTGAIANRLVLTGSSVIGNSSSGVVAGGSSRIENSTISGNSGSIGAGARLRGEIEIKNSTISGNTATGDGSSTGLGGGLHLENTSGEARLVNVTITNNTAPQGSGIYKAAGDLQVRNTIVSGNSGSADCFRSGPLSSLGNNIDGGSGCGFTATGDRQNTNPLLGPLADNGGPTRTHTLLTGSPAIDGGSNTGCPGVDQRGTQRPRDGDGNGSTLCDIGAVEAPGTLGTLPPDPDNSQNGDNSPEPEPAPPDNDEGGGDNQGPPGTPGQTTVSYVTCPGTTALYVQTLTGFAIGQTIRINPGGPTQEDAQVVDVGCNGRNLHLAGPLRFRHRAGEAVVVVAQGQAATTVNPPNNDGDRERTQSQRRTEQQRQQSEQTNRSGRDDVHSEGDVSAIDLGKQPPEITILTRDGPQTVQLLCGGQCPTIKVGDYVELDGAKQHEGLFSADTVTVTRR